LERPNFSIFRRIWQICGDSPTSPREFMSRYGYSGRTARHSHVVHGCWSLYPSIAFDRSFQPAAPEAPCASFRRTALGLSEQPVGRQLVNRSFYGRRRRNAHQHSNLGKDRFVRSHNTKPGSFYQADWGVPAYTYRVNSAA
jgi:hypothetical protein